LREFPQQRIIGETKYTVIEDNKEGYSFLRDFFENFPQDEVESRPGPTSLLYIQVKGNSASVIHCLIQLSKIFCKFCVTLNDISIMGTARWWAILSYINPTTLTAISVSSHLKSDFLITLLSFPKCPFTLC